MLRTEVTASTPLHWASVPLLVSIAPPTGEVNGDTGNVSKAMGDRGCLSIFGRKAVQHRLFAEHITAEYRVRTEGRGRTVDEWKLPVHKPDTTAWAQGDQTGREAAGARNHWFDCVVGCAAAASMQGVERIGAAVRPGMDGQRLKLSALQRLKR